MSIEEVAPIVQAAFGDTVAAQLWSAGIGAARSVTIEEIWSACLGATALVSTHLAGEGRRSAWVIGLASQVGWLGFMFVASNFGFIVSFIGFTIVHAKNLWKWTKNPPAQVQAATQSQPAPSQPAPCQCGHRALVAA